MVCSLDSFKIAFQLTRFSEKYPPYNPYTALVLAIHVGLGYLIIAHSDNMPAYCYRDYGRKVPMPPSSLIFERYGLLSTPKDFAKDLIFIPVLSPSLSRNDGRVCQINALEALVI